jgi:SAM-dependent methyltransferase
MACDPAVEAVLRSDPERGLRSGRVPARLYAGDVPEFVEYLGWTGLSLTQRNHRHIQHDLTRPLPFPDASVAAFQAEDVLEHIGYADLPPVLAEIHRVLKPGGRFRLSVPDYGCDVLRERTWMDAAGNLLFDPDGGGTPAEPGHLWFPRIDSVRALVDRGPFARSDFLHYWNLDDATFVLRPIDHDLGFVLRTPDFDDRVRHPPRPMSLVVDLIKGS